MRYKWKPESMAKYAERRGEEFKRDLFDSSMSQREFQKKHGFNQSLVSLFRIALVPKEQRRKFFHDVTPEMITAFKSKASNTQLAKRFKMSYHTLERMRRRYVGRRSKPQLRLTEQVMALLRSDFNNSQVARALSVHECTVWELRIRLKIYEPKIITSITDEQRAIIESSRSYYHAAKRLNMNLSRVRRWFFLVQEGLL